MSRLAAIAVLAAISGCASVPTGPTHTAMPGSRKSIDQFQFDDASCRTFAVQAAGATPRESATDAAVGSAVVGTLLGAAIGGLVGGSEGAAIGAGFGLFGGSAAGAGNAQAAAFTTQQRLDDAYFQCMYASGHKVPMPASLARSTRHSTAAAAPAPYVRAAIPSGSTRPPNAAIPPPNTPPPNAAIPPPNTPPPNAAIPPPNTPPPNAAIPPPNTPPPNAAIPPPNAPPPYRQR